jgi:hypothetical protein
MSDPNTPPRRPKGIVWLLFFAPGQVILWLNYYFPNEGQVWTSARQKGNPVIEVLYSLAFWAVIAGLVWMLLSGSPNH